MNHNTPGSHSVLDYLLAEMERLKNRIAFVLAGYKREMDAFLAHNPGLRGRVPHVFAFADYDEEQLLRILASKVCAKYGPCVSYDRVPGRRPEEEEGEDFLLRLVAR